MSLALAGLVLLVAAVFDWGLVLLHGAVYYPVCWQAAAAGGGTGVSDHEPGAAALRGARWRRDRTGPDRDRYGASEASVLRDTGNTLRDPMTNAPVLIVEWQAAAPLLPPGLPGRMTRWRRLLP